jgi:hypothetical protein
MEIWHMPFILLGVTTLIHGIFLKSAAKKTQELKARLTLKFIIIQAKITQ